MDLRKKTSSDNVSTSYLGLSKMCNDEKSSKTSEDRRPLIKLRSMTALIDENKRNSEVTTTNKPKGQLLKKALGKKLQETNICIMEQPVVDVFESIVNRKVTYTQSHPKCTAETGICCCDECKMECIIMPSKFGKVYPSPNEKSHTTTSKQSINYLKVPKNTNCNDIDLSLPSTIEGKDFNKESSIPQLNDGLSTTSNIPSIFGKVYVKKPPSDKNFFKNKDSVWPDTFNKANNKRKRVD